MRVQSNLRRRVFTGAALAVLASSAIAGEITLYQNRDFRGDTLTLRRAAPDLTRTGFNDRAGSVDVRDGVWEACSDANFRGNCTRLGPGRYDRIEDALNDRIGSVRELVGVSMAPPPRVATAPVVTAPVVTAPAATPPVVTESPPVVAPPGPRLTLFSQPGFAGSGVEITETHGNLQQIPMYNGASAVIVYGGTWRLCTRQYYRGECADFAPGRYDSLGRLNGRIYSAELISQAPGPVGLVAPVPSASVASTPGPSTPARIVLYELPNFAGQSLAIDSREMANLDNLNFGDRAASMRIEAGSWMICTDRYFRGSCTTFGPGEYPRLGPDVDHKIASVRLTNAVYGSIAR
jgi:hypothetical protein